MKWYDNLFWTKWETTSIMCKVNDINDPNCFVKQYVHKEKRMNKRNGKTELRITITNNVNKRIYSNLESFDYERSLMVD